MNRPPRDQDPPEDVDERYRRDSALDASRPSEAVRRAVHEHAERLAAERGQKERAPRGVGGPATWLWLAARQLRWRALVGTLAAAALAALVIAPEFLTPRSTPLTDEAPAAARSPSVALPEPAAAVAPAAKAPVARELKPLAAAAPPPAPSPPAPHREEFAAKSSTASNVSLASRTAAPVAPDPAAAFRHAAETGDLVTLRALRSVQPSLDARDSLGRTALLLATLHGEQDAVEMLLAWGADPNIADAVGTTPLAAAIDSRRTDLVATLKHYGAR